MSLKATTGLKVGGAALATISGSPVVGQTLSVPTIAGATYQWLLGSTAITGATSNTYTPTLGQVGQVTCRITLPPVSVSAAPAAPTVTTAPTLSTGSPIVGSPVTPTPGVYGGYPAPTVTAQWFYGDTGALISGAPTTPGAAYTPVAADQTPTAHTIVYIETATNGVGTPVASAAPTTAAVAAASVVVPSPGFALAQPAFDFSAANGIVPTDQKGIRLPAGASQLPVPGKDWFQWLFYRHSDAHPQTSASKWLGSVPTANGGSGLILGGMATTYPLNPQLSWSNGGHLLFPSGNSPFATSALVQRRGNAYMIVFGQIGANPFFACVQVEVNGKRSIGTPFIFQDVANNAPSGLYYAGNSSPNWTSANAPSIFAGLGGQVDVAAGANRAAFGGQMGGFGNIWGTFPNTGGVPTVAALQALASGSTDPLALAATSTGGVLRYYNHLSYPALAADGRGAITAPCTVEGATTVAVPTYGEPIRHTPDLTLDSFGADFVFDMGRARVPFTGTYANGTPSSLQGRLVRLDNGAVLVDWTNLTSPSIAGGVYSGYLTCPTAGVAFQRQVRWGGSTTLIHAAQERLGLGVVVFDEGQSQLAMQNTTSEADNVGSGISLVPSTSTNVWCCTIKTVVLGQSGVSPNDNGTQYANGRSGTFGVLTPWTTAQMGDGNIRTYESIKSILNVPVMFVDVARPGHHPAVFIYDRQTLPYDIFTALSGLDAGSFTPDGTTTVFSFTPTSSTFVNAACPNSSFFQLPKPGSVQLNLGGVAITDDGNGNLVGNGITAGTISYLTGQIKNLTFAVAPAVGSAKSGSFTFYPDYSYSNMAARAVLTANANYTVWGDGVDPTSGWMSNAIYRMRGAPPSFFRVHWWNSINNAMGQSIVNGQSVYSAVFDQLKAKMEASYPACVGTPWAWSIPAREAGTSLTAGQGVSQTSLGGMRDTVKAHIKARSFAKSLGEYYDSYSCGNAGPHHSPYRPVTAPVTTQALSGGQLVGERFGIGIAKLMGAAVEVDGPKIASAAFVDGTRMAFKMEFTPVDPAATALVTQTGATSGIQGIRVGPAGASTGKLTTGFTAAITGPMEVTVTSTGAAFTAGSVVGYADADPVWTSASAQTTDEGNLKLLLFDNVAQTAGGVAKYPVSGRPGNPVQSINTMTISG